MTASTQAPSIGNLLYSDVEDQLRATVRALTDKRAPWQETLRRTESAETTNVELWSSLVVEVGCAGLPVPEERGGAGASWREVAVVAEELGRAVAPVPFIGSAVMATKLLLEIGESDILSRLTSGQAVGAIAIPFGAAPGDITTGFSVQGDLVHGVIHDVVDAERADVILAVIDDAVYAIETAQADRDGTFGRQSVTSLDMTRPLSTLQFEGAAASKLAQGIHVPAAVARAQLLGSAILASEQLGVAERCLEMTVAYLMDRRQFGRQLGSYQALKHRLADLWVDITQARAVARYAAECAAGSNSDDFQVAAGLAKAHCSVVVQRAAEECVQLHGGIGFTWEHPAHLYLKRAKSTALALGSSHSHRRALSQLIDIAAPGDKQ